MSGSWEVKCGHEYKLHVPGGTELFIVPFQWRHFANEHGSYFHITSTIAQTKPTSASHVAPSLKNEQFCADTASGHILNVL